MNGGKGVAVFARKASGLVREASLLDTIFFGLMNNSVTVFTWYAISLGPYLFPGINMAISYLLAMFLSTVGFSFVWGILGSAMPRSGGSYVYNSRILHPAIGTAVSFCNACLVMTAWIWLLAPWIADPGLPILAGCMGMPPESVAWWTTPAGMYIVATIVNLLSFLIVTLGLRSYFRVQRVLVAWGLAACITSAIIFTVTPHAKFVALWNFYAEQYGCLSFEDAIKAVNEVFPIPETWNWQSTILGLYATTLCSIYGYIITFIGGEVKSPRRNIFLGQVLNVLISTGLSMWNALAFIKMVGWEGFHALGYIDNEMPDWYTMPFPPTYLNIASMVCGLKPATGFFLGGSYLAMDFLFIPFSYIAFSRALFAWGMDNLGPRWFTDVHPRFHSPVKLLLTEFIVSQAAVTHYCFYPEILGYFMVETLQLVSAFGITAISCTIFPFRKKVRDIWEASPHKDWKIGPVPVATISGILALILIGILVYASYTPAYLIGMGLIWTLVYICSWILGFAWYFIWRWYRAKQGIDVTLAFKELPPE